MILFLKYMVKNGIYRVSVICKLANKWYVMRMCTSWLCPFKSLKVNPIRSSWFFRIFTRLLLSFRWYNRPRSIYHYFSMAPRLLGQNCKFINCLSILKRDLDTKKTTPDIKVCPESLEAMLEYRYIERSLLPPSEHREQARGIKSCSFIGYPSGQDSAITPARNHLPCPQETIPRKPYNKSAIGLITVFDAILTGRQSGPKLQCLYGNPIANNFFQNWIFHNWWIKTLK